MTLDEFIDALSKTPRDWALDGDAIRTLVDGCQCPIDAVLGRGAWRRAIVGGTSLSIKDARMIVDAADWPRRYSELRGQLLQACGLSADVSRSTDGGGI
jgi:hypothetical protein